MIGTKVGPYEILEEVGRGGAAIVYRARQVSVERDVAIKVIQHSLANDSGSIQRFQREAKIIAHLEHPHILPLHDFDGTHEPPYIVMRYLDSGTLKEVMAQGLLPHDDIAYLMRQVCSGLDYAHRQGMVHRDIKPSNIMIDREGNAFVSDLGIARIIEDKQNRSITESGAIVGTPEYMSPEQAMGSDDVDHRADIYALGIMLFQMFTGSLPYQSTTMLGWLMKHVQETIPFATSVNPEVSPAINNLIYKAMQKKREDRYQSVAELGEALMTALGGRVAGTAPYLKEAASTWVIRRKKGEKSKPDSDITPVEQNKQLTVLHANLVEVIEVAQETADDPLEFRQSLWSQLDGIIVEYGGTIDTHTGDTVLALWGVKSVREDDPEQAVRAALAMSQAVNLAAKTFLSLGDNEPLLGQFGIHTGLALIRRDEGNKTYSASGSTVNMAARLEQAAPPGSILISSDTYNYIRGVFLVEVLEPIRFRGSKEAVLPFLVRGTKPRAFRKNVPEVEGIETKLIGRDAEFKLLTELMEVATEDQETQIVTIVGDAGIGKSRLLYEVSEWEERLSGDFWYFPAQAAPQTANQPFALMRALFAFRFDVQDSDPISVVQTKFEQGVTTFIEEDSQEKAHLLAYLFGLPFPDSPYLRNQDHQQLMIQAQRVMLEYFLNAARQRTATGQPSLGVWLELENIHHADDRSLDFVNQLVEEHRHLPLIVVCTARPSLFERRPAWGSGQDFHDRIDLRPLSKRDSRKLVKELLQKIPVVPDELRDLIVDRSEGNPFYMEELVHMLVEDHVIIKADDVWAVELKRFAQVRLPVTLTGLLQSRLDMLLPEERVVVQRASIIGRIFWDSAVKALQGADRLPVDVDHSLEILTRHELIQLREETIFAGAREYVFASTMLRDVAYESILKRQQRNYHLEAGHWLAQVSEARAEYLSSIAEHYEIAGEQMLAARYLYQAGEQAHQVSAYQEGINFLEHALDLIKGQVAIEARRLQSAIQHRLGTIHTDRGLYQRAATSLQESLRLARELDDKHRIVEALVTLGYNYYEQSQADAAIVVLEEGLDLALSLNDQQNMAAALLWLSAIWKEKDYSIAVSYLQDALAHAQATGAETLVARILNGLGEAARQQGKYEVAADYYEQAGTAYSRLGSRFGQFIVNLNLGHVARSSGQIAEGYTRYKAALRLAMDMNTPSITIEPLAGLAGLKLQTRDYEQAAELLGLILTSPTLDKDALLVAEPIQGQLRELLSDQALTAALERGAALNLGATIKQFLADVDQPQDGMSG